MLKQYKVLNIREGGKLTLIDTSSGRQYNNSIINISVHFNISKIAALRKLLNDLDTYRNEVIDELGEHDINIMVEQFKENKRKRDENRSNYSSG